MQLFWPETTEWQEALHQLKTKNPFNPFQSEVLNFTQSLSKEFIKMRQSPEIVALGYWLRKSNIFSMREQWEKEVSGHYFKARGTVFHLAPSNVDTIFIYSWMLSLLAGNKNIIRVSGKEQTQKNELLSCLINILKDPEHKEISERTIILTYEHDQNTTLLISEQCHTRVVWGGDETVNSIRKIPLAPMANELVFPDRFSLSILNAEAFLDADENDKTNLLEQFYNDSYWFDQMACSSPRLIIWIGDKNHIKDAQKIFWSIFEQVISRKDYELQPAVQVQKFTTGLWLAAEQETTSINFEKSISRVSFQFLPQEARERHCGGGLFYECVMPNLRTVSAIIKDKDQTLSYFGFSNEELIDFMDQVSTRGIDRIVPIGQALNFDGIWDGQNFLRSFMREVVIL
jgi:hypothetical protein